MRKSQAGAPSLWGPQLTCFLRVILRRALPLGRPPARIRWDARRALPLGRVPHEDEEEDCQEEEEEEG